MNLLSFLIEDNDPFAEPPEPVLTHTAKIITKLERQRHDLIEIGQHQRNNLVRRFPDEIALGNSNRRSSIYSWKILHSGSDLGSISVATNQTGTILPVIAGPVSKFNKTMHQLKQLRNQIRELEKKRKVELRDKKIQKAIQSVPPSTAISGNIPGQIGVYDSVGKLRYSVPNPYFERGATGQYAGGVSDILLAPPMRPTLARLQTVLKQIGAAPLTTMYCTTDVEGDLHFAITQATQTRVLYFRERRGSSMIGYVYLGGLRMTARRFNALSDPEARVFAKRYIL